MKNWKTALVLAVALGIFAGVAYWDERQTKKDQAEEQAKDRFFSFSKEDVVGIDYKSTPYSSDKDGKPAAFSAVKKEDGKWELTAPVAGAADKTNIEGIVNSIAEYKFEKKLDDGSDKWSQYRLDQPQKTVTLTLKNSEQKPTLYLGEKAPVGYSVYLRSSDSDATYIGSQHILTATSKTLTDVRDKTITSVDASKINQFSYTREGKTITFAKKDGKFVLAKDDGIAVDSQAIAEFVGYAVGEKAEDFADQPAMELKAAFAKPFAAIEWVTEDGKKATLTFAEQKDALWAAFDPSKLAYKLGSSAKNKLKKDINDFRDKSIIKFDSAEVEKAEINGQAFVKVGGDWHSAADAEQAKAEEAKPAAERKKFETKQFVQNLIVDLEYAKATTINKETDVKKSLGTAPIHRVVLTFKESAKKAPLTFDAWNDTSNHGKFLLKVSGRTEVFGVDANVLDNTKEKKNQTQQALGDDEDNGNG